MGRARAVCPYLESLSSSTNEPAQHFRRVGILAICPTSKHWDCEKRVHQISAIGGGVNNLELHLLGRFLDVPTQERCETTFSVAGLSPDDHCLVTYAGSPDGLRRMWGVSWHRAGRKVRLLENKTYNSAELALEAIRETLNSGPSTTPISAKLNEPSRG